MSDSLSVMTGGDDVRVIEAIELTARRHGRRVLDAASFQVRPGQVTGLLGLPGAGKTTVLRRMLQLDPGGGRTLYGGRQFRSLVHPMRAVGVVLDPLAVHPGRTVTGHLKLALSADPGAAPGGRRERIAAVLDVCGLTDQARTRIAELTEGMTVRLALAQALLGDPQALLLDEPDYGLEPEGLSWLTALLRAYAAQGRCVLVTGQSTDAMVANADRILVLDEGRLIGQRTTRQAARELSGDSVIVRTPQVLRFAAVLVAVGAEPTQLDGACLEVRGLDRARVGDLAFRHEIPLHELAVHSPGQDPVVGVLEACRRPPTVVPVQSPPAGRVPEHAAARVAMPFAPQARAASVEGGEGVGGGEAAEDLEGAQSAANQVGEGGRENVVSLLGVGAGAGAGVGGDVDQAADAGAGADADSSVSGSTVGEQGRSSAAESALASAGFGGESSVAAPDSRTRTLSVATPESASTSVSTSASASASTSASTSAAESRAAAASASPAASALDTASTAQSNIASTAASTTATTAASTAATTTASTAATTARDADSIIEQGSVQ